MAAFTYIVECSDGSLYTGWTCNIEHRIEAHNGTVPGGAKYTKSRRPVRLVWSASCNTKETACKLEYYIKQMPKYKKNKIIQGDYADIDDYISEASCVIIKG